MASKCGLQNLKEDDSDGHPLGILAVFQISVKNQNYKDLLISVSHHQDGIPHIALLASGGGQRSSVALMGFLSQLQEERLLDTLLYFGGVSGSTW